MLVDLNFFCISPPSSITHSPPHLTGDSGSITQAEHYQQEDQKYRSSRERYLACVAANGNVLCVLYIL